MDEHNNPYVSRTQKTKNSIRTITIDDGTVLLIENGKNTKNQIILL